MDAQESLRLYGENQVAVIPHAIRNITLAEFAKYNGSVQEYIKATTRHHGAEHNGLDRTTLKRKWAASQEEANAAAGPSGSRDMESSRGLKSGAWHVSFSSCSVSMTPSSSYRYDYAPEETELRCYIQRSEATFCRTQDAGNGA